MKRAPRSIWLAVMIAMLGLKLTFNRSVGAAEQATSQRRVQQLIEGAQKEGQVNLFRSHH